MISLDEFKKKIQEDNNLKDKLKIKLLNAGINNENIDSAINYSVGIKSVKFADQEFARWISDHNVKWMDFNFFCSDNVGVLSNCCRLLSDTQKLDAFINSIGGTALSVGSCRVSTINLARIAYEALQYDKPEKEVPTEKAIQKYLDILKDRTLLDCKALYSMRHIIERNIEKGLLPNYTNGAVELDKQFCTIGILGLYEVMDIFGLINTDEFGYKSYSDEAINFANKIFDILNEVKDNFECDFTFNIESIPGENCAGVICAADNLIYRDGGNNYTTYDYRFNIGDKKYLIKSRDIVKVNISGKIKEVSAKEAFDNDYDLVEEYLDKFCC